jgi:hypothetical protein
MRQRLALLTALTALCSFVSAEGRSMVEVISGTGVSETGHTWGYSSPKLLYDGQQAYAVALHGPDMYHAHAQVYWRDAAGWHEGAAIEPVYQPPTILLDGEGHINVFCTSAGIRGYHWRSAKPHDVTAFAEVELPTPEIFRFGYLGVGTDGTRMALAGLDGSYSMWLTVKPLAEAAWTEPYPIAGGTTGAATGNTGPCYPVVIPAGDQVHVIYSVSPDGSVHNTYNRVAYACFDTRQRKITRQDVVAESPPGVMTYGLDALRAPDGTLYSLHFAHVYVYGDKPEGADALKGIYLATLPPGGEWRSVKVTDSTGTAQLFREAGGALHVIESRSDGARDHVSTDGGQTFGLLETPAWPGSGGFLYVVKANSGSVMDDIVRGAQSGTNMVDGKLTDFRLEYVEYHPGE